MKVVVTGATGFIGRPLCADLVGAGHTVTALSRDAGRARAILGPSVQSLPWGRQEGVDWRQAVAGADVVMNLAGESLAAQRWTPEFKQRLGTSRVETTRRLVEAICQAKREPGALISTSAIGYYGSRQDELLTEASAPGSGFMADLCKEWEAEAEKATACGVRVVRMRVGVVLGQGGALEKMLYPLPIPISPWKLGLGGPMGSGRQWLSWVHLDDVAGLFLWAATNREVQGAVNATAPNPVTNAEFVATLGRVLHRPAVLPIPGFALKALVGEFAESLLTGQKVFPEAAQRLGYRFRYPDLETALRALLQK